jgi:hypothetical protein
LLDLYTIHLESSFRSMKTVQGYAEGAELFAEYLAAHDLPQDTGLITLHHIDGFLKDMRHAGCKPDTVNNRFRAQQTQVDLTVGSRADEEEQVLLGETTCLADTHEGLPQLVVL